MDDVLTALRAAGESTRLRILVALRDAELTVSELCRLLDQSQPRVSRHLRILHEAGLVSRSAEATSAYFRLSERPQLRDLVDHVLELVDVDDELVTADAHALAAIRADRTAAADAYFEAVAAQWDRIRPLHVADEEIERVLVDHLDRVPTRCLVDIGTGTGRMLELFAPRISRGIGVDTSAAMLRAARSRLDHPALSHCEVRWGDAYDLDLPTGSADVVVLHHVLHFLEDPGAALVEATRVLSPGGTLLIADFAPHELESLRTDFAHRHLGFSDTQLRHHLRRTGVDLAETTVLGATTGATPLDVCVWRAGSPQTAPSIEMSSS